MALSDNDLFLVNTNDQTKTVKKSDLMTKPSNDDYMLVNKASDNKVYKVKFSEVKQEINPSEAPSITSVNLAEDDTGGARFTNQSFTTSVTMGNEGVPKAQTSIQAKFSATLNDTLQTSAISSFAETAGTWNEWGEWGDMTNIGKVDKVGYSEATGRHVGVGFSNIYDSTAAAEAFRYSDDGYTWTNSNVPKDINELKYWSARSVAARGDKWVAVGNVSSGNSKCVIHSTDGGVNWYYVGNSSYYPNTDLVANEFGWLYGGTGVSETSYRGIFLMNNAGSPPQKVYSAKSVNGNSSQYEAIATDGYRCCATGGGYGMVYSEVGCLEWGVAQGFPTQNEIKYVVASPGTYDEPGVFLAVAKDFIDRKDKETRRVAISHDGGKYWESHDVSLGSAGDMFPNIDTDFQGLRYINGAWVAFGGPAQSSPYQPGTWDQGGYIIASYDGINWFNVSGQSGSTGDKYYGLNSGKSYQVGNEFRAVVNVRNEDGGDTQRSVYMNSINAGLPQRTLTFADNTALELFMENDKVTQADGKADGKVISTNTSDNTMSLSKSSGTWTAGEIVNGPISPVRTPTITSSESVDFRVGGEIEEPKNSGNDWQKTLDGRDDQMYDDKYFARGNKFKYTFPTPLSGTISIKLMIHSDARDYDVNYRITTTNGVEQVTIPCSTSPVYYTVGTFSEMTEFYFEFAGYANVKGQTDPTKVLAVKMNGEFLYISNQTRKITFSSDTGLDNWAGGDYAVFADDSGSGLVNSVEVGNNVFRIWKPISKTSQAWNDDAVNNYLIGPRNPVQSTGTLYAKLNSDLKVTDFSTASPGFVQFTGTTPRITFPSVMPDGQQPDTTLGAGTTMQTVVRADNLATSAATKTSNTITPGGTFFNADIPEDVEAFEELDSSLENYEEERDKRRESFADALRNSGFSQEQIESVGLK